MDTKGHSMNQRAAALGAPRQWREYLALCKPRVVSLIVFTAVIGMFLRNHPKYRVIPSKLTNPRCGGDFMDRSLA